MEKRTLVFISSVVFLFSQILILSVAQYFLVSTDVVDFGVIVVPWGFGIMCGIYSHWCIVYLKNSKNKLK